MFECPDVLSFNFSAKLTVLLCLLSPDIGCLGLIDPINIKEQHVMVY